jgi:hypothetical protein
MAAPVQKFMLGVVKPSPYREFIYRMDATSATVNITTHTARVEYE